MDESIGSIDKEAVAKAPITPEVVVDELRRLQESEPGVSFPVLQPEKQNDRPAQGNEYVSGDEITNIEHRPGRTTVTLLIGAAAVVVSVAVIAKAIRDRRHKEKDDAIKPGLHTIQKSLDALEALRKRGAQVNWRPWDRNPHS